MAQNEADDVCPSYVGRIYERPRVYVRVGVSPQLLASSLVATHL